MILKNYINISIKNIVHNKKNTFKIFFITFFSFILFILNTSLSGSLNNFIKNSILNTIEHRTIMINFSVDQNINIENKINNLLENDSSIIEFYEYKPPIAGDIKNSKELFNNDDNNIISLTSGFEQKMPDIIKGNIFNNNDQNVGIIPKNFDPTGTNQVEFKKESINYLDGEEFLGKTITIEFKNSIDELSGFKYNFKVIGVYDSINNNDFPSDVYIPYDDLKMINEKYNNMIDEHYIDSSDNFKTLIALVDNHKSVKNVVDKLRREGIDAFPKSTVGLLDELYKTIIYIGTIISITIFIISIINISLNNVNDLKKRQSELGMLKSFGYKNRQLKKIIIYESTIINMFSLFIGLVICKLIFLLLNTIVKNYLSIYMSDLKFEINLISISIGIFIMIFSVILSNLKSISYITNLNPIRAIRSKY
ncbi:ABC transporter permease [Clostridioides difficile]|nr:ABC transporter permease [Clostridioides difficile]